MQLSVEMSLYPLCDDYLPVIKAFIERLQEYPELTIAANTMSTQVFGEYDDVMRILTVELKETYEKLPSQSLVCKFINRDLRPAH